MKRFFYILILFTFCSSFFSSSAKADDWKIYASYHNPKKAVKLNGQYFVLANGDLSSYDPEDTYVLTYDKSNCLNDFGIYDIAACTATKSLVILYKNGNVDVMDESNYCTNMSEFKTSTLGDKTLNELCISGDEAFISTNSGLITLSLKNYNFKDTYKFDTAVKSCLADSKYIYAKTAKGTYFGDRSLNLLNPNNWKLMSDAELNADSRYSGLKNENISDDKALANADKYIPESPIRNYSYKLNMIGNRLLVAGGNFYFPEVDYVGTVMRYENGKWTAFDEKAPIAEVGQNTYMNVTDVVQDPNDSEHHWLGTKRSGIYEFRNYKMVKHYSNDNSPLTSILPNDKYAHYYVRVTALNYDPEGNLWMCNNETDTIVKILKADGKWIKYYYSQLEGKPTWDNTYFDSRGWAWINCRRTTNNHGESGMMIINTNGTINTQKDDTYRFITSFSNLEGTTYSPDLWYCAIEDLNGAVWVGNTAGIFMVEKPEEIFDKNYQFNQIKVPRNDGSDRADYLLSGVPVKCIAIDGANRKWVGTVNNGVYLISADGLESIHHFTKDNSPLISDVINSIAINGETGEVFIATDAGLCSFKGDATDPEEELQNSSLKVFPNPVRPEYSGDVHITGLAYNTDVKIANAAGKLVYEGTSNGGQFNWNCCNKAGKRVSSGIYYALCTDEGGKKGACAKILIVR